MADLTQEEWRTRLEKDDNAVILDVRTLEEMEEGFIPEPPEDDGDVPEVDIETVKAAY